MASTELARSDAHPEGDGTLRKGCRGIFITGTDTSVGKTRISLAVMRSLQHHGLQVTGMKPVASGCDVSPEGLRNEDALLIQQHASRHTDYTTINPYAFRPAIAPHIAARQAGVTIELAPIAERYTQLSAENDAVVVEGAGGWLVPLNETQSMADLAVALDLPVILVVAIRLGCINHALLAAQAIRAAGCHLAGWIANHSNPAEKESLEIILSIKERIAAPMLGHVDYQPILDADRLAAALDGAALMQACEK